MWTGISSRRISACPSRRRAPSANARKQTRCLETAASKCRCRGGAGRCDAGWGARHGRTGQSSPCPGTQTSSSRSPDAACWVAGGGGGRKGCEMMERAKMAARRRLEVAGVEGCGPSAVGRGLAVTGLLVRAANLPRHGCAARRTEESHQESETSMVDFHAGRLWKMIPLPLAPLFTACGGGNSWRGHFQRHGLMGCNQRPSPRVPSSSADTFWNVETFLGASGIGHVQRCANQVQPAVHSHHVSAPWFPAGIVIVVSPGIRTTTGESTSEMPADSPDGKRPISFSHHDRRVAALPPGVYVSAGFGRPGLAFPACNIMSKAKWHHYAVLGGVLGIEGPGANGRGIAVDCRKTGWGFHPFSFLGAALRVVGVCSLTYNKCIFGL